jgi:hypothetical protein
VPEVIYIDILIAQIAHAIGSHRICHFYEQFCSLTSEVKTFQLFQPIGGVRQSLSPITIFIILGSFAILIDGYQRDRILTRHFDIAGDKAGLLVERAIDLWAD